MFHVKHFTLYSNFIKYLSKKLYLINYAFLNYLHIFVIFFTMFFIFIDILINIGLLIHNYMIQ